MRATIMLFIAALALGACSKSEGDETRSDLASSGKDIAGVAREAAKSPDWAKARADLRRLGHDIGAATRSHRAEAGAEARKAGEAAKDESHKLASDVRSASQDERQRQGG